MIELDRTSAVGLADQIAAALMGLIERGELLGGARLPSVRQMAKRLSVSPFTVIAAYDKLVAKNSLVARHGSGYYVAARNQLMELSEIESTQGNPSEAVGFTLQSLDAGHTAIKAGSGFLPQQWLAEVVPPALVSRVARAQFALTLPAPAQGLTGLRRQLAERLQGWGVAAVAGQVVTTLGASHAFDLIVRSVLQPGDTVAVEDPGYLVLLSQLKSHGLRLVAIPRLADGPDLDALEEAARLHKPKLFFTQTLLHNPTGTSTSAARCHKLLLMAERLDFRIVEDDALGDLAADGVTRLAALDELRRVFYVGSFTKLLSPALRVGYVAVPRDCVDKLVEEKILSVLGTPSFTERVVEEVLASGRYQRHTKQVRSQLRRFRQRAHAMLQGAGVEIARPVSEGLFIWGRVPGLEAPDELVKRALGEGILLAKGSMFSPTGSHADFLRFNAAHCCEARLADFLRSALTPRQPAPVARLPRPASQPVSARTS
ncbi:MAG: PLP-dependent aminotransferase family protein [Pseudomonadota bacterium]